MRTKLGMLWLAGAAMMLAAGVATAGEMPSLVKTASTDLGTVLTDSDGMTLYYFDKDVTGKSNCNDKCAEAWPPLMAADDAKSIDDFSVVVRDDGGHQWAHRGLPLYRWVKDEKPGDTTGHRFKNVWTVAQP